MKHSDNFTFFVFKGVVYYESVPPKRKIKDAFCLQFVECFRRRLSLQQMRIFQHKNTRSLRVLHVKRFCGKDINTTTLFTWIMLAGYLIFQRLRVFLLGSHFESQQRDSNPERRLGKLFPGTGKSLDCQKASVLKATTPTKGIENIVLNSISHGLMNLTFSQQWLLRALFSGMSRRIVRLENFRRNIPSPSSRLKIH
jgi:hypothetical protein